MSSKRNRNLLVIIGLLLVTNIALLLYMFWWKDGDKNKGRGGDFKDGVSGALQKEVGFSQQQLDEYKKLRSEHWKVSKPMYEKMQKSRDSLFSLVKNPDVSDSSINLAASSIAQQQKEMDLRAFYHFRKVRAICLPEQTARYDSLMKKISNRKMKPGK